MPTATYPPRCPHRVATTRPNFWLVLLLASLIGSTTATESLHGQEISLLDYRFAILADHVQPWSDVETNRLFAPATTPRIAAKWRTNLTAPRKEKKLPAPEPKQDESNVEILVVPKAATPKAAMEDQPQANQLASTARDCYQAPPLAALSVSIALPSGKLPTSAAAQCAAKKSPTGDLRLVGAWAISEHHWSATCSRHRPLYFEEINAERYGYTASYVLQPLFSAARFFATIPALPYKMAVDHPRDCIYTLGHYRPGSCVPRRRSRLPAQLTAVAIETGFIAGMILLIP